MLVVGGGRRGGGVWRGDGTGSGTLWSKHNSMHSRGFWGGYCPVCGSGRNKDRPERNEGTGEVVVALGEGVWLLSFVVVVVQEGTVSCCCSFTADDLSLIHVTQS